MPAHRPMSVSPTLPLLLLAALLPAACGGDGQPPRSDLADEARRCDERGAGCGEGEVCVQGLCVARGDMDGGCASSETLRNGSCQSRGFWPGVVPPDGGNTRCSGDAPEGKPLCVEGPDRMWRWVECDTDSDCADPTRPRCHPALKRCVPDWSAAPGLCAPCGAGGAMDACSEGFTCRPQAPPGGLDPTTWSNDYCQPDGVVAMPGAASCPEAGFVFDTDSGQCVPSAPCAWIAAALAELSCSAPADCAPPGWSPGLLGPALCVEGRCRVPCATSPTFGSPVCPPGMTCMGDATSGYCVPSDPGGGAMGGGDPPPSD